MTIAVVTGGAGKLRPVTRRLPERNERGTFLRTRQTWTPEQWDNGHIDSKGRFRVYRPDCPRAYQNGYAMRAHVVYWLATGALHPPGTVIHHRNEDRLDDRFENLEVIGHGAHTRLHHLEPETFVCLYCEEEFTLSADAVGKRRREGNEPKFCSQACYHAYPRSSAHRAKIGAGLRDAYALGRRG